MLDRVDLRLSDLELPDEFEVINVECSIGLQCPENRIECCFAGFIRSESGFETELRVRHKLLRMKVDLLDRFVARRERFSEIAGELLIDGEVCRVPDPIEKCAECRASPISTIFLNDQRSFQIHGKLRHTDLFDTSR